MKYTTSSAYCANWVAQTQSPVLTLCVGYMYIIVVAMFFETQNYVLYKPIFNNHLIHRNMLNATKCLADIYYRERALQLRYAFKTDWRHIKIPWNKTHCQYTQWIKRDIKEKETGILSSVYWQASDVSIPLCTSKALCINPTILLVSQRPDQIKGKIV